MLLHLHFDLPRERDLSFLNPYHSISGSSVGCIALHQAITFTGFPLGVTSGTYLHTFDLTNPTTYNMTAGAFFDMNGDNAAQAEQTLLHGACLSNPTSRTVQKPDCDRFLNKMRNTRDSLRGCERA